MHIQQLLSQRRVLLGMPVSSKKRLLEKLGELLGHDAIGLNAHQAFQALIERERLGSTGIGEGVALPHGRVKGLERPVGAFCTLERAMDFDSIDHKPVTMVFALLVPERANEEHLKILSELAGLFSNKTWRQGLLAAKSQEDLYDRLTHDAARPHDSQTHDR